MSKHKITIDHLWAMKRMGAVTLSPDGRLACSAVTSFDMDTNKPSTSLWMMQTDGSAQAQLTRGNKDGDPQWSPDGTQIAFVSKRDEPGSEASDEQIYVISPAGGEARRVTKVATGINGLRWLPDGKHVAFVSFVWPELSTTKEQTRRFHEDKKDKVLAHVLEDNHSRYWDHWYPRGRKAHIHIANVETGKVHDLFAKTGLFLPPAEADAGMFDFSPDGLEIVFTYDSDPNPSQPSRTDLVAMDLKTKRVRTLTSAPLSFEAPRYSPDGKWIASVTTDFTKAHNEQARLSLIGRSGGAVVGLTARWDRGVGSAPVWSADSQSIYFLAEHGVSQPVWRTGLKDKTPALVVKGAGNGGTASDLTLSANGTTLAYARSSQNHPPSLFAANADGANERGIERFNDTLLKSLRFGSVESVEIKGFNKESVQMWIVTPANFDAKKKWPLLHSIHGGPHTCLGDVWHWRWNMHLFAAAGYVVTAVNYHGSTGWGQSFVSSINGDWGRRELADVEAGTDFMLKTGYIDAKRMVATGGSYGGYMVAYMNGNVPKGRYQAFVCHAGCYDWVSMMGSDGYMWLGKELGAYPWKDEARVLKQSPHHYAANFATPTLVVHGELDYRVPYNQGMAYYQSLKAMGVPARLVFFPDENHWILKPQNSRLWYKEFLGWCDRFTTKKAAKNH